MNASCLNRVVSFLPLVVALSVSAATHTLTINIDGSGSVATNPTATAYPHNSTVTLTAASAAGWQFNNWSGDISGTLNPTNVLMDVDKVISANFIQIPSYILAVNVSEGGTVSPNGGTYLSNSVVQLTATASTLGRSIIGAVTQVEMPIR